jgi:hypothetical protein
VVTRKRRQSQAQAERRSKTLQALALRASGATYKQIAQALEVSEPTAWRIVQQEAENAIQESAREILDLELTRLDRLQMGIYADAISGDLSAIDRVLKIMEQRAKLLGLYDRAPQQDQLPSEGVVIIRGETTEDYIAGLRAIRAAEETHGVSSTDSMRGPLALPPSNGNGQAGS